MEMHYMLRPVSTVVHHIGKLTVSPSENDDVTGVVATAPISGYSAVRATPTKLVKING
jgi:hypothetical protein